MTQSCGPSQKPVGRSASGSFFRRLLKPTLLTSFLFASLVASGADSPGAKPWYYRLLPTVSGDVAVTKERAERGNMDAQLELANRLVANQQPAQASGWYRKLAEKGNVEAKYRLGGFLLFGAKSPLQGEQVLPEPNAGIRLTFEAATNFHVGACQNMAAATETGLAVPRNLIETYAWLELAACSNAPSARADMNRLALTMDLKDIQSAHELAQKFKQHEWTRLVARKSGVVMKLNGVTVGQMPLAIINGRTLAEGETTEFPAADGLVRVKCVRIDQNSVEVAVDGESESRLLVMK